MTFRSEDRSVVRLSISNPCSSARFTTIDLAAKGSILELLETYQIGLDLVKTQTQPLLNLILLLFEFDNMISYIWQKFLFDM